MINWNHRVFRQPDKSTGSWYTIREAYYDDDGNVDSFTADIIGVCGESIADMKETLQRMKNCLDKPVIELDENGDLKKSK